MHSVHMLETVEDAPAARLQRLAGDAVVAVWETQGGSAAERVVPVVDGEPVRRPYTTLTVRTGWGGSRHIAVFRWRTGSLLQLVGTADAVMAEARVQTRSEEHTSELQSLMRISYAVFCLKKIKQP